MSRVCQLTGKKGQTGNRVSKSNAKTKHRFGINLQTKRIWSESKQKFVSLRVCTSTLRTIDKMGLDKYLKKLSSKAK